MVRDRLGIRLASSPGSLLPVDALVGLAVRRNPKRAQLLVSRVLAKHVPTPPALAIGAGRLLGAAVAQRLGLFARDVTARDLTAPAEALLRGLEGDAPSPAEVLPLPTVPPALGEAIATLGYAETATGLGHLVAEYLGSYYVHSTREATSVRPFGGFEEEHSHATGHVLVPTDPTRLASAQTVVLVDDELSTGRTILNTVRELQAAYRGAPAGGSLARRRYVVATLVDLRSGDDRAEFDALARELGCELGVVALGAGTIELPGDVLERAAEWLAESDRPDVPVTRTDLGGTVVEVSAAESSPLRSARFGVDTASTGTRLSELAQSPARTVAEALTRAGLGRDAHVVVLGSEEHLALPLAIAAELGSHFPGTLYSSTTRSPVHVLDEAGYAIRSAVAFASHGHAVDGGPGSGTRYAYNLVTPDLGGPDAIVYVPEPGTSHEDLGAGAPGVTEALARQARTVVVLRLDAAPPYPEPLRGGGGPGSFGSYRPEDAAWLLKDLSGAALEAPAHEREAAIQSGRASYAESLPQEYEPSPEYQALFHAALAESKHRIAQAVADVIEQVLALRNGEPVLVSLARAGTPVGILMRRWAMQAHGLDVPHYTMSIVRGLGIDRNALRYLLTKHRPEQIMFVDGWTGKGAITRELAAAVTDFNATELAGDPAHLSPELAVLADPGHCVRVFGTREDFLIPSACLNSTVSGLVSRTVFNRELVRPHDFHGAKFYGELAGRDVSNQFVDTVAGCFGDTLVGPSGAESKPEPTWAGWAAVERIAVEQGIGSVNLVKPGVGETTRVLLRRVPWKVLARPELLETDRAGRLRSGNLAHVLLLAEQRGVPVEPAEGLPYSCVGLIRQAAADA
ncbi:phosphoribosyltransferase [Sinomonas notoginsengisoli]|uniref:phosphoribosyltransferase domain-containing protein n=1 Tax=Sinomonas notoginsengisoli TaxID=1457311 RepID=UPI001F2A8C63|nr:phosphoribosyltransferase domain-containing protein [Sinomonas notoginsengisoli]